MNFKTIAIHGDKIQGLKKTGDPVIHPRVDSTIFRMPAALEDELIYSRHDNPNRSQLETILASLEGGEACAAFSSGMAASTAIVQSLKHGDHIIIPHDLYHGTRKLVTDIMEPWGLQMDAVDMTKPENIENALKPNTKIVWVETPSNPLLHITDIEAAAGICRHHKIILVVDNTWPSPVNQQPLLLGADYVMHSTSKYIGGHSDLLGGAVIAKEENGFFGKIRDIQKSTGAVPSPGDCWLMLRSIRTLPLRVKGHNENAVKIAGFLEEHKKIERVFFPGLKSHPGYETARKQMNGFGGMISFLVKGGREATSKVVQSSELIVPATSLGAVESTWEHRILSEGPDGAAPENLVRLSTGLEDPEDLIRDIDQALG